MKTFWRIEVDRATGHRWLVPADRPSYEALQSWDLSKVRAGDLKCPRNPQFNRLVHALGGLAADNLDAFEGMDCHRVLKRLQIESGVACEEMAIRIGKQMVIHRLPQSLSFASMDEDSFHGVVNSLCDHLVTYYWPTTEVKEILKMADEADRYR